MTITISARTRAGFLVVALALVGGTGCLTMAAIDHVQEHNRVREREAARERRVAQLTPRADAGEPAAMTALAFVLSAEPVDARRDLRRIRALLDGASRQGYVYAQAVLGEMLASGRMPAGATYLPAAMRDRPRGIVLLQQVASQTCLIRVAADPTSTANGYGIELTLLPAGRVASLLELAGRNDEARVWRARSIVHCGQSGGDVVEYRATAEGAPSARRQAALAFLLLSTNTARIEAAQRGLAPDDIAAARRQADDLRRQVAESEREFPAPQHKELP